MADFHHASVKRATRLGVELFMNEGEIFIRQVGSSPELISGPYDKAAEALEEMERGEVEWAEPEEEDVELSGSVVKDHYRKLYSLNPQGPGCGDQVDVTLRNAVIHIPSGSKVPCVNKAELRNIGVQNDLWKGGWEALNPGLQRMNLSNRLRAFLRNNQDAEITLGSEGSGRFGVVFRPAKGKKAK